jgi:protein-tyrosine phosphatase
MIDVHHHLLYGLDDGPATIEQSIAMANMAVEDGITHVACTPHANHQFKFDPQEIALRLDRLRAELAKIGNPLILGRGCDFHVTFDAIQDAKANPGKYTINGNQYLLVELPDQVIPMGLQNTFNELQHAGLIPILTHPERNPVLQHNPDRMKQWISDGLLIQITASSLLGRFGPVAQKVAHRLLRDDWVHIIATDAHNTSGRPPRMRASFDSIAKSYGAETAQRLCIDNPRAIFEGEPLDDQPEPAGISEEFEPRRSWLQRLFAR